MKWGWRLFAASMVAITPVLRAASGAGEPLAPAEAKGALFVTAEAFDWRKLLPAPPAEGSLAARADLETVLRVQESRTPAQVTWAQTVVHDNAFGNAQVLGDWFKAANLPVTAEFFREVDASYAAATHGLKKLFPRLRPPYADARVHPCIEVARTGSYPSGHSLRAWMWAELLAEIFPEKRAELLQRARAVAWGRVIGGAHFPTDTVAGEIAGRAIATEMLKNPAVRAAIVRCRAEATPFLLQQAA